MACFKRSFAIRAKRLGGENFDVIADCYYNIGLVYKQTGNHIKVIDLPEPSLPELSNLGDICIKSSFGNPSNSYRRDIFTCCSGFFHHVALSKNSHFISASKFLEKFTPTKETINQHT